MVDSNKIGPLTRTWPSQPINKDKHRKDEDETRNKDEKKDKNREDKKDPGDTIVDEYV